MTVRSEFELAEVLWDVAEPCLSDTDREAMCIALHAAEPIVAIGTVVRALARSRYPLPRNVFGELTQWLRTLPAIDAGDGQFALRMALQLLVPDVPVSEDCVVDIGGYGDATLVYFILDEADAVDAPPEQQADELRKWLAVNRPSPVLRADLRAHGFGHLLDGS